MSVSTAQPQIPPTFPTSSGFTPGPAVPRISQPRRRSPAMVSLGVVLVVVGALAGWRYVASASTGTSSYLAVYQPVSIGQQITAADLQAVSINSTRGLTPIPASQASRVIGEYAKVQLVPGTLLTEGDLMATNVIGANQALIGLELSPTERPARPLKAGDQVMLVAVPPASGADTSGDTVTMPTLTATVVDALAPDSDNNTVVDVIVPVTAVSAIAALANQSRVAAVLVSGG